VLKAWAGERPAFDDRHVGRPSDRLGAPKRLPWKPKSGSLCSERRAGWPARQRSDRPQISTPGVTWGRDVRRDVGRDVDDTGLDVDESAALWAGVGVYSSDSLGLPAADQGRPADLDTPCDLGSGRDRDVGRDVDDPGLDVDESAAL